MDYDYRKIISNFFILISIFLKINFIDNLIKLLMKRLFIDLKWFLINSNIFFKFSCIN